MFRPATASDRDALVDLQMAAYAPNRIRIGREPMPLTWDYDAVLREWDVSLAEDVDGLTGALVLHRRARDLYIESVAVAPRAKGGGLGNRMLDFAFDTASRLGYREVRLLTNALNEATIAWYQRRGFAIEKIEAFDGRRIVHMVAATDKSL